MSFFIIFTNLKHALYHSRATQTILLGDVLYIAINHDWSFALATDNDKFPQVLCNVGLIPSNPEHSINVGNRVQSVDFNHDDTTLAWALLNGDIKLWDVSTKKE